MAHSISLIEAWGYSEMFKVNDLNTTLYSNI